ncbi:MAG: hypothetical protein M1347_07650 [Chloroflexi bacterium]|nr:hypothetical protein [Chloroflexota bacterium]
MATTTKKKDSLNGLERWLQVVFITFAMLVVFWFFSAHEQSHTGFFTNEFGIPERLALYGPIFLSMIPPVVRASVGSRNAGRPWEAIANIGLAIGSLWLFFVFPFNFAHLADVLPAFMQIIFSWISDGVARIVLLLQILIAILTAGGAMWKYASFVRE